MHYQTIQFFRSVGSFDYRVIVQDILWVELLFQCGQRGHTIPAYGKCKIYDFDFICVGGTA
jgi:hypothetical protein